jgi:hypothetical protein
MIYPDDKGSPEFVEVSSGGGGGPYVEITFGGGFGHWGIDAGYPGLVLPANDEFYTLPWKPGIYFWDGP